MDSKQTDNRPYKRLPKERGDEPLRDPDGRMYGYGFTVWPELKMRSTSLNEIDLPDDVPDLNASASTRARNFRNAFAVVGALIGENAMDVTFDDEHWAARFESWVNIVADTLTKFE